MQKNEIEDNKTKTPQLFEHPKTLDYQKYQALAANVPNNNKSFASNTHNNLINENNELQQFDRPLFDVCCSKERFLLSYFKIQYKFCSILV